MQTLLKKKHKKYEMDMVNGAIFPKMLRFALPLMASSVLQIMFNAADIIVVGRFSGDNALAAVGSTSSLINLLTNLFLGLSIGVNVLCAREYGRGDTKELSRTVHSAIALSIISGLFLSVVGIILAPIILEWMNTPTDVLSLATVYLRIYFLGMAASMIYNFASAILRAVGDTKRPLYFLTLAGIVNVVFNLFFVIVLHWSVAGVAVATVISQCLCAYLILRCMKNESGAIRLIPKKVKLHKDKFILVVKYGLPAGVQGMLFSISNVLIQSSINSFGAVVVAGNSAASNLENFVYFAMDSFYHAALSFTSQNMGAGKKERIGKVMFWAQVGAIVSGVGIGCIFAFFGSTLLKIYSTSPMVIEQGVIRLRVICTTYALCGMMDIVVGVLRGMGCSIMPMIVSLIGICGFRIFWLSEVFTLAQYHNVTTVYISYPISWILTFAAHLVCYFIVKNKINKKPEIPQVA